MNVLITGGLGHIGSKLFDYLLKYNSKINKVIIVDNLSTNRYCSLFKINNEKFVFYDIDILDKNFEKIVTKNKIHYIIHLAAITDATSSFSFREKLFKNNLDCTKKITALSAKIKAKLIFISSTSVYGKNNSLATENTSLSDLSPQSPYAECKLLEEKYIRNYNKNLKFIIFRFGTICGYSIGMRFHTAVNKFCFEACFHKPLTVWRTALNQKRPYLSLIDAVRAINFVIATDLFNNSIYNVLNSNYELNVIISEIRSYFKSLKINYVNSKIMNQLNYIVSKDKLIKKGFSYTGSIKKDIAQTIVKLRNKSIK